MTRVLIVDDIAQNLYMLRSLLQGHGFAVEEACQGAEALDKARQSPPDLVVSDLLMPVMDGYTLLRHWKADEGLRRIPFIVYTATYTDPKDERLAIALGADAFVIKPAEPEALMAAIGAVLERAEGNGAVAGPELPLDEQRLLADYNEALVRKLEKRALQLQQTNQDLQAAIAESRRSATALQESEERFRATFEQAAVGIAHVGVDGRCLRVNDKLCDITGYPREELLRLKLADLTLREHRDEAAQSQAAMLAGTQASHVSELRYRRMDGGVFWGNCVSTLLRDAGGQPQYFIAVVADVTERRLLEEQFRQAQKIESIGQLTGGIAHDFNNLLTVIIGNAELLTSKLEGDEALKSLAHMTHVAALRGADLTRRLLAFARRQSLDPRAVDVNSLLLGMEGMLRRMLREDIELRFVPATGLWPALVDPSQLESAVLNLGINARDAMPSGGRLTIATANVSVDSMGNPQQEPGAGDYVCISVSDTGCGIHPEHLAHVFEPFFTTKPAGVGTGLGLSMVHGFVKQSRGHITIETMRGQGTALALYLPRSRHADALPVEARPEPADLRGTASILLVEDEDLVRHYAERQLLALGYRVSAVENAAAALALLQSRGGVDLLLTDIVMPGGMNGRELAEAALSFQPGLKVLFCSGYAEDDIAQLGLGGRRANLLTKPYGSADLARKVHAVLADPVLADPVLADPVLADPVLADPVLADPAPAARPATGGRTLLILDDDPTVAIILGRAAETLGFKTLTASTPQAFFDAVASAEPSHVAIDLSMPEMNGQQILDGLAREGCGAHVIIFSGSDPDQLDAASGHGRRLGLRMAGVLAKPFSLPSLTELLMAHDIA